MLHQQLSSQQITFSNLFQKTMKDEIKRGSLIEWYAKKGEKITER
jgi:hypothetical protein